MTQMISAMYDYAQVNDRVSFESEIFDWVVMSRYIGQRLSEFAQKTQHSPEYFVSADNKTKILRAFNKSDFRFFGKSKKEVHQPLKNKLEVTTVRIRLRIQNKRRNRETISLVKDEQCPVLCPVLAALRIVGRAKCLKQENTLPMGIYKDGIKGIEFSYRKENIGIFSLHCN